jgi:ubiquitin carboxyl-terminal hydrolase 7
VSGFTNLEDSLSSYLHYEVLEGDNMYRTEKHGLQAARKGVRIGSVGPVLMIQLKRFQYNYETEVN